MSHLRPNQHTFIVILTVSSDFGKSNSKNTTAYFFTFSYFLIQAKTSSINKIQKCSSWYFGFPGCHDIQDCFPKINVNILKNIKTLNMNKKYTQKQLASLHSSLNPLNRSV